MSILQALGQCQLALSPSTSRKHHGATPAVSAIATSVLGGWGRVWVGQNHMWRSRPEQGMGLVMASTDVSYPLPFPILHPRRLMCGFSSMRRQRSQCRLEEPHCGASALTLGRGTWGLQQLPGLLLDTAVSILAPLLLWEPGSLGLGYEEL